MWCNVGAAFTRSRSLAASVLTCPVDISELTVDDSDDVAALVDAGIVIYYSYY